MWRKPDLRICLPISLSTKSPVNGAMIDELQAGSLIGGHILVSDQFGDTAMIGRFLFLSSHMLETILKDTHALDNSTLRQM